MKIQQSNVTLTSVHFLRQQTERTESLSAWFGPRSSPSGSADIANTGARAAPPPPTPRASASPPSTAPSVARQGKTPGTCQAEEADPADLDPKSSLIKAILEKLFGEEIKLTPALRFDAVSGDAAAAEGSSPSPDSAGNAPPSVGWGVDYQSQETQTETEQMAFSAGGWVMTEDGQKLGFELKLELNRSFVREQSARIRAGDAPIDPLVINFNGQAAQLTRDRFQFDLNADGRQENIASVKAGSAFLVLDKNQDGRVDDGRELFGPATGNGFGELKQYDQDGNDWIDENDPVYQQLRLWNPEVNGGQLATLAEKGVGAIYLKNQVTPYGIKDPQNEALGEILSSSVVVSNNYDIGTIQQLNLIG